MVSEVTCTRFTGPKRRLPKSATRHDPRARLTAESRSSPVPGSVLLRSLCVCRVFVPPHPKVARYEMPESRLATSSGAAASHEDLAISACRVAPERRTCLLQATLLETYPSTLVRHRRAATEAWSGSAAGSPTKALVPPPPREGRQLPENQGCFPPYACRRDCSRLAPRSRGRARFYVAPREGCIARASQHLFCTPDVRPALTSQAHAGWLSRRVTVGFDSHRSRLTPGFPRVRADCSARTTFTTVQPA